MHKQRYQDNFLGLLLGTVILFAVLSLYSDISSPNSVFSPHFDGGYGNVSMLFMIIPLGPLWKKIRLLFSSQTLSDGENENSSLTALLRSISTAPDQESAAKSLLESVNKLLNPEYLQLYLFDPQKDGFVRINQKKKKSLLPDFIEPEKSLPYELSQADTILAIHEDNPEPQPIEKWPMDEEQNGYSLIAPISSQTHLKGWLEIGPPKKTRTYQQAEIQQIEILLGFFILVYEKSGLDKKLQDMLGEKYLRNRIDHALLNAENFDQGVKELYQHLQDDFAINHLSLVLLDPQVVVFQRVLTIEDGKTTVSSTDPQALEPEALEKDAITTGQVRWVEAQGAWLIIPLVSNEEVLGSLRLGYDEKRVDLQTVDTGFIRLLADALLVAVKLHQLKQENQRQVQQLDVINKVNEQLTSIMHLDSLLDNILDAAMNILNCSSGVLMVIDENQDELKFEVTAGPVAAGMQGARLPTNAGIAGEAYTTRRPAIKNRVKPNTLWFNQDYPESVALIENIMAVPMIAHGHVIGILELINKKNGLPFNESDQKILESFANQAAVAVHNASLYSETDQALEARVEELYIMQQIDQELNASRDIDHALQRMLSAALRYTGCRSGTIGLIDREDETYENIWQIRPSADEPLMLDDMALPDQSWFSPEVLNTEQLRSEVLTASCDLPEADQWHFLLFSELEEDRALLLMIHSDSADKISQNNRAFLIRLRDHGIIALKNALLYEELHEVIHAKNEFISFISHELKNPLTVIKGYADILRKGMAGDVNEEQVDYLSTINHNVKRMNTFIKDLSDQAHIETKSLRLDFEPTPVQEVVNEVLHSYEAQIGKKSLQITLHIPADIPDVWCDRMRLIQVLANLISNAVKYSPDGREITIGAEQSGNTWDNKGAAEVVHFWVQDNGYGIAPEDQPHLFEKFYRGTDIRIKKIPGTGLGLRISKSLVEMMGGKMWFESALDEGSIFHFTLPI